MRYLRQKIYKQRRRDRCLYGTQPASKDSRLYTGLVGLAMSRDARWDGPIDSRYRAVRRAA